MNKAIYEKESPTKKDEKLTAIYNTAKLSGDRLHISIAGCNDFSADCIIPNKYYPSEDKQTLEYIYLSLLKYEKWICIFYREISSKIDIESKKIFKNNKTRIRSLLMKPHYILKNKHDEFTGNIIGQYFEVNRTPFCEVLKRLEALDELLRLWADEAHLLNPNQGKADKFSAMLGE